jgi:hypothetical protein
MRFIDPDGMAADDPWWKKISNFFGFTSQSNEPEERATYSNRQRALSSYVQQNKEAEKRIDNAVGYVPFGSAIWNTAKGDYQKAGTSLAVDLFAGGLLKTGASWLGKGLSKVVGSFSPINPGPLAKDIANTFRSATYTENIADGPINLYRIWGGEAKELGQYWSRTKPAGSLQAIMDNALLPAYGNTAEKVTSITVPKGTVFYEGIVGPQGNLVGGGNQIFIPRELLKAEWLNK